MAYKIKATVPTEGLDGLRSDLGIVGSIGVYEPARRLNGVVIAILRNPLVWEGTHEFAIYVDAENPNIEPYEQLLITTVKRHGGSEWNNRTKRYHERETEPIT